MSKYTAGLAEKWAARMTRNAEHATALMPDESAEMAAILYDYAATLRQQTTNSPEIGSKLVGQQADHSFASPEALADWLESLHETNGHGAITGGKWEPAQVAACAIRSMDKHRGSVQLPPDWRREGMVVMVDSATGELLGCMGRTAWDAQVGAEQAERGDGAVSDGWDGEAYANMAGELESWKRRALQAEHFIEHEVQGQTFMGEPLLRAPAEQGGKVDATSLHEAADEALTLLRQLDPKHGITTQLEAVIVQSAQGEVVGYVTDETDSHFARFTEAGHRLAPGTPLYAAPHAERARVPAESWTGEIECCDAKGFWLVLADNCPFVPGQRVTIAAAPSHPEDAA